MEENANAKYIILVLVTLLVAFHTLRKIRQKLAADTVSEPSEGEFFICRGAGYPVLYYYRSGVMREVTTVDIASSWGGTFLSNETATTFKNYDCTNLFRGPPLQMKGQPEPTIPPNISVRTTHDCRTGAVYYYDGKYLHKYPSSEVALQWDLNYTNALAWDCANIPVGEDAVPHLPKNNSIIGCLSMSTIELFYYNDMIIRPFSNRDADMISAIDPNWKSNLVLWNCRLFYMGPTMTLDGVYPKLVGRIKQSVRLLSDYKSGNVYYYDGRILHKYPTDEIAKSWDVNYKNATVYDCSNITIGEDAKKK